MTFIEFIVFAAPFVLVASVVVLIWALFFRDQEDMAKSRKE